MMRSITHVAVLLLLGGGALGVENGPSASVTPAHRFLAGNASGSSGPSNATYIIFSDNFETGSISTSRWSTVAGGALGTNCGTVGAQALTFSLAVTSREAITQPLYAPNGGTLSFVFRLGNGGTCELADPGDYVVLESSRDGEITWTQEWTSVVMSNFQTIGTIEVTIAANPAAPSISLRWRQVKNGGANFDEWMLDDVELTSSGYVPPPIGPSGSSGAPAPVLVADFDTVGLDTQLWTAYVGGALSQDCGFQGVNALMFGGTAPGSGSGSERQLTSRPLYAPGAGSLSFYFRLGDGGSCEKVDAGEYVVLETSRDGGATWAQVWTSALMAQFTTPSTITVPIAGSAGGGGADIILRWRQLKHTGQNTDEWMIDSINYVAIGGRGSVSSGSGPGASNPLLLFDNFDSSIPLNPAQWTTNPGTRGTTCGYEGVSALYFKNSGTRTLVSKYFNAPTGGTLSFYFKYGDGSGGCEKVDSGEYVVVEAQPQGGTGSGSGSTITVTSSSSSSSSSGSSRSSRSSTTTSGSSNGWTEVWKGSDIVKYRTAQTVVVRVGGTGSTPMRLRWRQVKFSGSSNDEWMVDSIEFTAGNVGSLSSSSFSLASAGMIVGIVFGSLAGLAVLGGICFCCCAMCAVKASSNSGPRSSGTATRTTTRTTVTRSATPTQPTVMSVPVPQYAQQQPVAVVSAQPVVMATPVVMSQPVVQMAPLDPVQPAMGVVPGFGGAPAVVTATAVPVTQPGGAVPGFGGVPDPNRPVSTTII